MDTTITGQRSSVIRKAGWLGVASMLAVALLGPAAGVVNAGLTAAVYTSNADGSTVNENIYPSKDDVYLTGGPCPQGGDLPDGDYYYEVVQPAGGGSLLSTDNIGLRKFTMSGGFIISTTGHTTHALSCNASAITIQLSPYNTSANGEYKLQVATAASVEACKGFDANTDFPICQQADQKSDNFKVRVDAPAIASDKVADPTIVPAAGADVTYTYTVSNTGNVALINVTVVDDKCDSPTYVSGDTNNDQNLDTTETWIFTCTTLITVPTVNTATATGYDGDVPVTAQAQASVDVAPPVTTTSSSSTSTVASSTTTVASTTTTVVTSTTTVQRTTTTSFSQSVEAATGHPSVTLPPTDSLGSPAAPSTDSWRILLIAMAALLATALVLTPATASRRR